MPFRARRVERWIEQFLASTPPRDIARERTRELDRIKRENSGLKSANRRKDDVINTLVQGLRKESTEAPPVPKPDASQAALRPLRRSCRDCSGKGIVLARSRVTSDTFSLICPHDPERLKAALDSHSAERIDH